MKKEYQHVYKQIGINIRDSRRAAGITQEQLAEMVNKSVTFISHLEAPGIVKAPSLDTLIDIARALHVPLRQLVDVEDDKEKQ